MTTVAYIWRNVQNDEAQFFGKVGRWDISAGFFKGFGLGFLVRPGEFDLTLGCFSVGGARD